MALLNILKNKEPELRKVSRPVEQINSRILTLLDDMRETLAKANGIGLAAPQVGILRRVAIIEDSDGTIIEMINPEIIERSGMQEKVEGCLSSPGDYALTSRPMTVKIRAINRHGEIFTLERSELSARAICHEIDHLNGVMCYDNAIRLLTQEEVAQMREE